MQEEYWAAQNEIIWENQVTELSNQNATLSNQNAVLRRLLQQAGIDIPST